MDLPSPSLLSPNLQSCFCCCFFGVSGDQSSVEAITSPGPIADTIPATLSETAEASPEWTVRVNLEFLTASVVKKQSTDPGTEMTRAA